MKFIYPCCGYSLKLSQKRVQMLKQQGHVSFDHKNIAKIECHMCHMGDMVLQLKSKS